MANPKPSPSQRTSSTSRAAGRHLWFADLVHALTPKPRFAMLQVVAFEQGGVGRPARAVVQRLCAVADRDGIPPLD